MAALLPGRFEYLISFTKEEKEPEKVSKAVAYVSKRLRARGLIVEAEDTSCTDGQEILKITTSRHEFEIEAEHLNVLKEDSESKRHELFIEEDREDYTNVESVDFFAPCERAEIVYSILEHMEVDAEFGELGHGAVQQGLSLMTALKRHDVIEDLTPMHEDGKRKGLWKRVMFSLSSPLSELRAYYGAEVALYFAWMDFFTLWLLAPGAVGAALWFFRPEGTTVDDSPYIPFFSLFMVVWGVFFLVYWRRRCAALSCVWGTLESEQREQLRPEFTGTLRKSPVTGLPELYYPSRYRWGKYVVSALVTLPMLTVAFSFMVCSLNLQGYIETPESPFHVAALYKYALPGAVFDPNGPSYIMPLVPVITHCLVIFALNTLYRGVAERLTDWENHRTEHEHENALILKRFLFEAFDCYIALFYLAFYELDIAKLRSELVSLYTSDSIRRVLTESVLPLLVQRVSHNSKVKRVAASKKNDGDTGSAADAATAQLSIAAEQLERDEYEQFDDYLEMVMEFGYITLFAAAFPLASALSVLCNLVEVKSDAFKLSFVSMRPRAQRACSIGTWEKLLTTMVWLSLLTNCLIFGFTSEQLMQWVPSLFYMEKGDQHLAVGTGRYVVGIVFGLEHMLLLLALAIYFTIPHSPKWVRVDIARRAYESEQAAKTVRLQLRKARAEERAAAATASGEQKSS